MSTKKLNSNGFIAFLLLLIITIGLLSYQNASEYADLKDVFKLEKEELELELNRVIKNYEGAVYNKDNAYLNLSNKLHDIIKLKDTINSLKSTDYRLFRFYRKRISSLAKQNEILFKHIDSLNSVNNQLLSKNDSVSEVLALKESQYIKLNYKKNYLDQQERALKEKVAIAEIIKTSVIKVAAMKKEEVVNTLLPLDLAKQMLLK
ncbi:hypothetical protein [Tenacibaculum retecalamus]|uniref:hypothetical protein n=1 Tax=Tenacibaculum retecalamus TaxID=3018315 RepID=UPI0023D9545D|nr:hypothetical protein [Tenacibaculum retecalamus]WBX71351.1 hypothetical protein PG912_00660 [Tenacibaculum retecalamus]